MEEWLKGSIVTNGNLHTSVWMVYRFPYKWQRGGGGYSGIGGGNGGSSSDGESGGNEFTYAAIMCSCLCAFEFFSTTI